MTDVFDLIVKQWANDGIYVDNYAVTSKNIKIAIIDKEIWVTDLLGSRRYLNIEYHNKENQEIIDIIESILVLIHRASNLTIHNVVERTIDTTTESVYRFHNHYYDRDFGGRPHAVYWDDKLYILDGTHRYNRAYVNRNSIDCSIIEASFSAFETDYYNLFSECRLDNVSTQCI